MRVVDLAVFTAEHDDYLLARMAALPDGYANLLAPHNREQVRDEYGGNGAWLTALKRRFDPDGVFVSATPLPGDH